jgi:hypothetical protein
VDLEDVDVSESAIFRALHRDKAVNEVPLDKWIKDNAWCWMNDDDTKANRRRHIVRVSGGGERRD